MASYIYKLKNLQDFLIFSNQFYNDLLGYNPKQTKLKFLNQEDWIGVCKQQKLDPESTGMYLPRNRIAIIPTGIRTSPLSLFHEYFGHGLYCEQSLEGKKLFDLEKQLLEEEKREFQGKQFTLEDIEEFRLYNPLFQKLDDFRRKNLGVYESFAIFTEYLLSRELDLRFMFGKKYKNISEENRNQIDEIISLNRKYGDLVSFYSFGLARITNPERVKNLLSEIYKDRLKGVKFAVLYGSKKEFSDIDIFMVVNSDLQEAHSDWLDIKTKSLKGFERGIRNFDVRTVVPIATGEFIFGDKDYFKKYQTQLLKQPITEEAIKHNLKQHYRMLRLKEKSSDDFLRNKFQGYAQTYLANTLALRAGRRLFSKEDLSLSY